MITYIRALIQAFVVDEEGASAVEYGLILGLIVVGLIAVLAILGDQIGEFFGGVSDEFSSETGKE